MLADWSHIRVTPGTRQSDRLAPALGEGFFRVDDRDLAARLALLGDLAQHIAFVDGGNRVAGSWRKLFDQEPAIALAEFASLPLGEAALRFEAALAADWRQADAMLAQFARRLEGWLNRLAALPDSPFTRQITLLKSQGDLPRRLKVIGRGAARAGTGRLRDLALVAAEPAPADPVAEARADEAALRAAHALLLNVVAALRPTAERTLAERLRSRRIDPALGLLLAELGLLDRVAGRINAIPERLVLYYYREVLGQAPRGAAPERVLLRFPAPTLPVLLPAGSRIEGRIADRVWSFATDTAVKVVPARVAAQAVLRYDTDPRISLNASLAGITGIRAEVVAGEMPAAPRRIFGPDAAAPVDMGLEIASPAFWLAEGTRRIEVDLDLRRRSDIAPGDGRAPDAALDMALADDPELLRAFGFADPADGVAAVAALVRRAARDTGRPLSRRLVHEVLAEHVLTVEGLRLLLGRIVTGILIDGDPWPEGRFWQVLSRRIEAAGGALSGQRVLAGEGRPHSLIGEAFRREGPGARFAYSPEDVFEMLLGDAFRVELSTAAGPYRPAKTRVRRRAAGRGPGLTFQIKLDRTAPPIVAPPGAEAPTLTLRAAPGARLCPQSFLEPFRIETVFLRVEVRDMSATLAGYGEEGRIDLGQSFAPFGIRPRDGASFVVAAPEMAVKPVSEVRLAIDWADLPGGGAGFARHYARYGRGTVLPEPVLVADYLSSDGWKPLGGGRRPMYPATADGEAIAPGWQFEGAVQGNSVPATGTAAPEAAPARGLLRAGAVRLTLSGTSGGFLAEAHSAALVAALRPRLWPHGPRALPQPPFVPQARAVRLGYTAREAIAVAAPDSARPGERVTQITPFGRRTVFPRARQADAGIFPQRLGYGAHYVMIEGPGALGPIALLFEMSETGHDRVPGPRVPISWHYLGPYGWERLPDTALSVDTTDGLMRSGVVAIDIPDDAVAGGGEMPGAGYWIAAVAGAPGLDNFPVLRRVQTNAVWATGTEGQPPAQAARSFAVVPSPPGVPVPVEVPVDQARRPPETVPAFKARVAERLRHRQRAVTPWDVERLVLDAFPEVWMAKCLPCLDARSTRPAAGRAMVVVVPHAPDLGPRDMPRARLFDPLALRRIEAHLRDHASFGAGIEVRNPGYEILQLRGRVRLDAGGDDGAQAQRLRLDMARELSVWTAPPGLGRFGWSLNLAALHARIEALPYVAPLTEFSILHLVHNDAGEHVLHDTARLDPAAGGQARLAAAEPWGLPLSARDHILTSVLDDRPAEPRPTGIGGLRVGDMLIVSQGSPA